MSSDAHMTFNPKHYLPKSGAHSKSRGHSQRRKANLNRTETIQDYKNDLNNQIHQQESQSLAENSENRRSISSKKQTVAQIQQTLSKLKAEMEREEKQALKSHERELQLKEIEFEWE